MNRKVMMKYLKMQCNKETLKIAHSIIPCRCGKGVGWKPTFCGSDLEYFLITDESDDSVWIEHSRETVYIPLDNIAIDPFRAMQHQLPIVADFEIAYPNEKGETTTELITHDGVIFKAEQYNDEFLFCMAWSECGMDDWDVVEQWIVTESIRLDYKELPEGAEVVEID